MIDRLIKMAQKDLEPPWDEVRERRVLERIRSEKKRREKRKKRIRFTAIALVASSVAILIFMNHMNYFEAGGGENDLRSTEVVSELVAGEDKGKSSTIKLAGGATAILSYRAKLIVVHNTTSRTELRQDSGKVTYDVPHLGSRTFVVYAGGVEVRVKGTRFVVDVNEHWVKVSVERGVVSVHDGIKPVEVQAGQTFYFSFGGDKGAGSVVPPKRKSKKIKRVVSINNDKKDSDKRVVLNDDIESLIRRADRARVNGNIEDAAKILRKVISRYPKDPRAASARFILGRVESRLGRYHSAAEAYHEYWKQTPGGPLAEDAMAEEVNLLVKLGEYERAGELARLYLEKFPNGIYVGRIKKLLGE